MQNESMIAYWHKEKDGDYFKEKLSMAFRAVPWLIYLTCLILIQPKKGSVIHLQLNRRTLIKAYKPVP